MPLAVGGAAVAGAAFVALVAPKGQAFYPRCPLYSLTHIYCPMCGATRAAHALAHGDLVGALHNNIVLVAAVPIVAALWVVWLLRSMGKPVPRVLPRGMRWTVVLAAFLVLYAVLRNIPVAPFTALAPLG